MLKQLRAQFNGKLHEVKKIMLQVLVEPVQRIVTKIDGGHQGPAQTPLL
jgi:hypothetical protein